MVTPPPVMWSVPHALVHPLSVVLPIYSDTLPLTHPNTRDNNDENQ